MKFALGFALALAACGGNIRVGAAPPNDLAAPAQTTISPPFNAHWASTTAPVFPGSSAFIGNYFYVNATFDSDNVSAIQVASVQTDGSLDQWQSIPSPQPYQSATLLPANGRLYFLGGSSIGGPSTKVFVGDQNADGSVDWTETTALPDRPVCDNNCGEYFPNGGDYPWEDTQAFVFANHIYALDWFVDQSATIRQEFFRAEILADGALGAWVQVGTVVTPTTGVVNPLPEDERTLLSNGDMVYIVDSHAIAFANSSTTPATTGATGPLYARIAADGTIGAFTTGPAVPGNRENLGAVIANNFLYVFGGQPFDISNDGRETEDPEVQFLTTPPWSQIQAAPIKTDGSIGDWTSVGDMPTDPESGVQARGSFGMLANDGVLYLVGGCAFDYSPTYKEVVCDPLLDTILYQPLPVAPLIN